MALGPFAFLICVTILVLLTTSCLIPYLLVNILQSSFLRRTLLSESSSNSHKTDNLAFKLLAIHTCLISVVWLGGHFEAFACSSTIYIRRIHSMLLAIY
jgi:hypothetical protein